MGSTLQKQLQAGRYAHAKQYKRLRGVIRNRHTKLGRVICDVERKATTPSPTLAETLNRAKRLHAQKHEGKNKRYAWQAPEVKRLPAGMAQSPAFGALGEITALVSFSSELPAAGYRLYAFYP